MALTDQKSTSSVSAPEAQPLYLSHHKCATGWTSLLIQELCARVGVKCRIVHSTRDLDYRLLEVFITHNPETLVMLTNVEPWMQSLLGKRKAVHVIRDPRDLLVSAYFSHRNSHKPWDEYSRSHFSQLQKLPLEQGLLLELEFSAFTFESIQNWNYQSDLVHELRYETLSSRPKDFVYGLAAGLELIDCDRGLGPNPLHRLNRCLYSANARSQLVPSSLGRTSGVISEELDTLLQKLSFSSLTGRKKGKEDPQSHLRKGTPGDWRTYFSSRVTGAFKACYPGLIPSLGYEHDDNW